MSGRTSWCTLFILATCKTFTVLPLLISLFCLTTLFVLTEEEWKKKKKSCDTLSQKFSFHQQLDGQHRLIVRDQKQASGWVFEAHNDNSCVFCEATDLRIEFLVLIRSGPKRKLWHWSNDQLTSYSLRHTVLGAHVGANRRPTAEDRRISFHYFIFKFQSELGSGSGQPHVCFTRPQLKPFCLLDEE